MNMIVVTRMPTWLASHPSSKEAKGLVPAHAMAQSAATLATLATAYGLI